jgi:hypothetical protein
MHRNKTPHSENCPNISYGSKWCICNTSFKILKWCGTIYNVNHFHFHFTLNEKDTILLSCSYASQNPFLDAGKSAFSLALPLVKQSSWGGELDGQDWSNTAGLQLYCFEDEGWSKSRGPYGPNPSEEFIVLEEGVVKTFVCYLGSPMWIPHGWQPTM